MAVGSLLSCACAPEITPPWLIDRPLDLGLRVEVEELGPLSEPIDDFDRPLHEVLPFDTVRATPLLVDQDGPIPPEDSTFAWVRCNGLDCLEALLDEDLQTCDDVDDFELGCSLGTGPTASLEIGALPPPEDSHPLSLVPILSIAAIGSTEGRSIDSCREALRVRSDLSGCFTLLRGVRLGPISDLIEFARSMGYEIDDEELSNIFLMLPRNRVPHIDELVVTRAQSTGSITNGGRMSAAPGEDIRLTWVPSDVDRQVTDILSDDGTTVSYADGLIVQWWTTDRANEFEYTPLVPSVEWTVGNDTGEVYVYALVTDNKGAESLAWFVVDVG